MSKAVLTMTECQKDRIRKAEAAFERAWGDVHRSQAVLRDARERLNRIGLERLAAWNDADGEEAQK